MSNIDLFDYDKTIDLDIASTKYIEERKRSKSFESVFEDTQYPNQSSEAFTPVLPSVLKMGKLFKLRSSSQSYNISLHLIPTKLPLCPSPSQSHNSGLQYEYFRSPGLQPPAL